MGEWAAGDPAMGGVAQGDWESASALAPDPAGASETLAPGFIG